MKTLFALSLFLGSALGQTVLLTEDFSSGIVPPAGWTENNNGTSAGWEPTPTGMAWHDDFFNPNDNWLISPVVDCSSVSQLFFHADQIVRFASYRDRHAIEISVDGGTTFTTVVDDQAPDGSSVLTVDMTALGAGQSSVVIAVHYVGDFGSEWTVDNIVLSDSAFPPPPPILGTLVNPNNGHTYHLLGQSTWTEAQNAAVLLGGNLATVDDQSENDWIMNNLSNFAGVDYDIWIGANDVALEGTFVWADGSPLVYSNWAPGQPDNNTVRDPNGEQYVLMYGLNSMFGPGQWNDLHDVDSRPAGFGFSGVVEINSTANPLLTVTNLTAGQTATVSGSNCTPNNVAYFVWSVAGGGPVSTPFGTGYVSPPFNVIPMPTDANGAASFNQNVPAGTSGLNIWFHGADLGSTTMLNPLAMTIG